MKIKRFNQVNENENVDDNMFSELSSLAYKMNTICDFNKHGFLNGIHLSENVTIEQLNQDFDFDFKSKEDLYDFIINTFSEMGDKSEKYKKLFK